ncbi:MAG: isochorismate synthase [Acidimicrobiales bacterium]
MGSGEDADRDKTVKAAAPARQRQLTARTRHVDRDVDVLATLPAKGFAWWHDGWGFVADGVLGRVPASRVDEALSDIAVDDEVQAPGTGPIAVGAMPFDPAADPSTTAEMVIPAVVMGQGDDGRTWVTHIDADPRVSPCDLERPHSRDGEAPERFDVSAVMSRSEWACVVATALEGIAEGRLKKVVLARQVIVSANADFSLADVVSYLCRENPRCYVFAIDGLVGASPELLVQRRGDAVLSRPMAGTVTLSDDGADHDGTDHDDVLQWLASSRKNRWEHRLVVDAVVERLVSRCLDRPRVSRPDVEVFSDLAHIVTNVEGNLAPPAPSALGLALELHPTPAVAGEPTEPALELISRLEPRRRGRYGGPVGWVDARGDGEFAVALRCAQVHANRAVLYAGAGIVAGSTWETEWQETQAKLEPMLKALTRH